MPDAIITSTASTFGTISGTFAADQSTVTGTVTGIVAGTLSGSVGVPGPAGPAGAGVPAGGTAGQFLQKIDGTNYNTDWVTLNLSAYLTKAANLSDLTNFATARDNLSLGTLNTPTFAGLTVQGSGANVANLTPTSLSLNHATSGSFVIQPSSGITFPDTTIQTTAFNATAMLPYALIDSQVFTGTPSLPAGTIGVTAALGDNDTSLATTAFVQQELLSGTANAKNLEVYVRNQTGSTLAAGSIVYINGATGNRPTVTLAQANNDANSAQTMGFVKTAIANNGFGYVIVRGEIEGLDTQAVAEGTQLYLSPTVAGAYTTTKPSAPQHLVYVGIVIRSHPTQGVILVAVQNGYELNELHDVSITSPTNGQVLKYNSTTGLWYNGTDSAGVAWGGITGTLSSQTDLQTALDGKYNKSAGALDSGVDLTIDYPAGNSNVLLNGQNIVFRDNTTANIYGALSNNGLIINEPGIGFMQVSVTGLTFADTTFQSTAFIPADYLSKAGNLSGLANTGTARTNLGLGTMATETASNYLTTATASTTYAPLASPTFTGTPTLPTGTIAVTQSAGNNTTAVATTAFVQQEVPAASTTAAGKVELATNAEVVTGTSTTLALVPGHAGFLKADPRLRSLSFFNGTSISGSGALASSTPQTFSRQPYLASLATGRSCFIFGAIGGTNAGFGTSTTKADQVDFSKKLWLSGYACMGWSTPGTSYIGDSNTICRITLGGYSTNTTGDMTLRGIGLKKVGGASSTVSLTVHNGTTLTDVASSVTVPDGGGIHWLIYSDGTGNVTLYINGTQAATTTAGPTSATASGSACYREQVEATATPGVRQAMNCNGGWLYIE